MTTTTRTPARWFYLDYMGTSMVFEEEPAFLFELRLTRCYELAGMAVASGDLPHGTVVHGSLHGPGGIERIGHGWVVFQEEPGDPLRVWEPITGKVHDKREWYAWVRAWDERCYDQEQTILNTLRDGTWGRWHESEWP